MANLNYRASDNGKQKRREQAARYRSKCKQRQANCGPQHETAHQDAADQSDAGQSASPCEGYHKSQAQEKSCCHRPGCYERFTPAPRSPLQHFVLSKPREAVLQSQADYVHQWDPRMSASGNRVGKRLALLLDCLAKMNSWLRYKGRAELQAIEGCR